MIAAGQQLVRRIRDKARHHIGRNSRKSSLALVDQVVVGGTAFLTTMLVGRISGSEELGLFALGLSIVFFAIAAQESLVTSPYTIFVNRFRGRARTRYTTGVLAQFAIHAVLVGGLVALGAATTTLTGIGPSGIAAPLWVLALILPIRLLREMARRHAYAAMNTRAAVVIGVVASVLQVLLLVALAVSGYLSATTALAAIGVSSGLVGLGWLWLNRPRTRLNRRQFALVFRRNLRLGKWYFAGQMSRVASYYSLPWIIVMFLGKGPAGVFAACGTLVGLANPLVAAFHSVFAPRISVAQADSGQQEVQRIVWKATVLLSATIGTFCVATAFFGGFALELVFGADYAGYGHVIAVLAFSPLAHALVLPAGQALFVLGKPRLNFAAQLIGIVLVFPLTILLIDSIGIFGAAVGHLAELALIGTVTAFAYWMITRQAPESRQHRQLVATASDG